MKPRACFECCARGWVASNHGRPPHWLAVPTRSVPFGILIDTCPRCDGSKEDPSSGDAIEATRDFEAVFLGEVS